MAGHLHVAVIENIRGEHDAPGHHGRPLLPGGLEFGRETKRQSAIYVK